VSTLVCCECEHSSCASDRICLPHFLPSPPPAGLGRVLIESLGLESVARVNTPMVPGVRLEVACVHVDARQGIWRLDEAPVPMQHQEELVC
jgi:hypothetical protein